MADGDYNEDDIWGSFEGEREYKISPKSTKKHKNKAMFSPPSSSSNTSSPKSIRKPNGMNMSNTRQSAPVNIPDWSKIYQNKNYARPARDDVANYDSGEDDEDSAERVPPHEWLARKMAKSNISYFSVCEGAGRTLKGRDLSRVRHAVLTKTGFLE